MPHCLLITIVITIFVTIPTAATSNTCDGKPVTLEPGIGLIDIDQNVTGKTCVFTLAGTSNAIDFRVIGDTQIDISKGNSTTRARTGMFLLEDGTSTISVNLAQKQKPAPFEVHYTTTGHFEIAADSLSNTRLVNMGQKEKKLHISIARDNSPDTLVYARIVSAAFTVSNATSVVDTILGTENSTSLSIEIIVPPNSESFFTEGYAHRQCSGHVKLSGNVNFNSINGNNVTGAYRCLKLYSLTTGFVELDFHPFVGFVDFYDSLLIRDSSNHVVINSYNSNSFLNKYVSMATGSLVIEYVSPIRVSPQNMETIISLTPRQAGGISKPGQLSPVPKGVTFSRYVFTAASPKSPKFLLGRKNSLPKASDMKVYQGNPDVPLAHFSSDDTLPESIAVDGTTMVVDFSGNALSDLSKEYKFTDTDSVCDRVSSQDFDSYNFNVNSSCSWVIAPEPQSGTRLLYLWNMEKYNKSACIDVIQSNGKSFSLCGVYRYKAMPAIALPADVKYYITAANGSSFSATHSYSALRDNNFYSFNITQGYRTLTSIDYPEAYPLGQYTKFHGFTGGKFYLVIFTKFELNKKDSFILTDSKGKNVQVTSDNYLQQGDVLLEGNSTITFNSVMDYGKIDLGSIDPSGRGYVMNVSAFDSYKIVNDIKSSKTTSEGCSQACLFVLTSRTKSESTFQKRISFKILQVNQNTSLTEILVYDDRSARQTKRLLNNTTEQSSSDTIVVIYRFKEGAKRGNLTLPELTIDYTWPECETKRFCDNMTRCIREEWICNMQPECDDFSDEKYCNGTHPIPPKIIETGMGGISVFILSLFTFILGIVATMYGPIAYRFLENYMRSGQYSTFVSE